MLESFISCAALEAHCSARLRRVAARLVRQKVQIFPAKIRRLAQHVMREDDLARALRRSGSISLYLLRLRLMTLAEVPRIKCHYFNL